MGKREPNGYDDPCNIGPLHDGPCNGIPRLVCHTDVRKLLNPSPPTATTMPGVSEEFLEKTLAALLGDSMRDAKGDQTLGVALALKRVFQTGFKMGQACPEPPSLKGSRHD